MKLDLKNPRTQRWIIVGLVSTGVLYAYFGTAYLPVCFPRRAAVLKELQAKEAELTRDVRQARAAARDRARLEAQVASLEQRWANAQAALPDRSSPDEVLREVSVAAQETNVTVSLVKPLTAKPGPQQLYVILPATVDVTGRYGDITLFLHKLASCQRLLNVGKMKMTAFEKKDSDQTMKASLQLLAFARSAETPAP